MGPTFTRVFSQENALFEFYQQGLCLNTAKRTNNYFLANVVNYSYINLECNPAELGPTNLILKTIHTLYKLHFISLTYCLGQNIICYMFVKLCIIFVKPV